MSERNAVGVVPEAGVSNRKPLGEEDWVRTGVVKTQDTPDATPVIVYRKVLQDDEIRHFVVTGTANEVATGDSYANQIRGLVEQRGGTAAIVGTPDEDVHEDAGAAAWALAVAVSGNEFQVTVTGEAAHNLNWNVRIELT